MTDEFTAHRKLRAKASASTGRTPLYAMCLRKLERPCRLYRIDPVAASVWRCEVWIGSQIHRTALATSRTEASRRRDEYRREVEQLLADGWMES